MLPITLDRLGEIRIFWLAKYKTSDLTLIAPENVHSLIECKIGLQAEDGGWWHGWKWGQYEDVWLIAEKEWAGKMTMECLHTLSKLNLIE